LTSSILLDPDIVDLKALDVYVPMPKSVWLDKAATLKQADIKATDTLMVQSKAASDQATMTNKLNELSEHYGVYQSMLKVSVYNQQALYFCAQINDTLFFSVRRHQQFDTQATNEYASALAQAAAAEDAITQQMRKLVQMTGEEQEAVGAKRVIAHYLCACDATASRC
jgi:hypothetical protein